MVPILLEESIRIPPGLENLEAFRRWARSDDFPERGRFAYLRGEIWVDLSTEQAFTHNQVKTRYSGVLDPLALADGQGYYFSDGMLLSIPEVDLSTIPDAFFVTFAALREGRVRLLEGARGDYVELVGAPDMVLEVVSNESVRKDTKMLRTLYWEAGRHRVLICCVTAPKAIRRRGRATDGCTRTSSAGLSASRRTPTRWAIRATRWPCSRFDSRPFRALATPAQASQQVCHVIR
jgi:hypothetical protein